MPIASPLYSRKLARQRTRTLESLEPRRLLSVAIYGTAHDDVIDIRLGAGGALLVTVNGDGTSFTPAQYAGGISIDTLGADRQDKLTIEALPAVQTTVNCEGVLGATVGSAAAGLADIASTGLTVGGTTGTVRLTVDDASSMARHVTLGAAAAGPVTYDVLHGLTPGDIRAAVSRLSVNLGNAGNSIDVLGTAPGAAGIWRVVDLNTGTGVDTVNVRATAAGTVLNLNGQAGGDSVNVSDPAAGVNNILGVVNVTNANGLTNLLVDDTPDTDNHPRSISLDTFDAAGATHGSLQGLAPAPINFVGTQMQSVAAFGGRGALNSAVINNTPGGGMIVMELATARVLGTAPHQKLFLDGIEQLVTHSHMTIDFSTGRIGAASNISTDCDIFTVIGASPRDRFTPDLIRTADGTAVSAYGPDLDEFDFSNGTLVVPTFFDPVSLNLGPAATVVCTNVGPTAVGSLTISAGSSLTLATAPTSDSGGELEVRGTLSVAGRLDVGNNTLVAPIVSLDQMRGLLREGLGGRNGITSSVADASHGLGYAPLSASSQGVRVRLAQYGDTNLDGTVDFSDLLRLAQNYGRRDAFWEQGDFNYDGTVGFADLLKLAQNYGRSA